MIFFVDKRAENLYLLIMEPVTVPVTKIRM